MESTINHQNLGTLVKERWFFYCW